MTKDERKKEFRSKAEGSVEMARRMVQNMLHWTEYVPEREYSTEDHEKLLDAFEGLYLVVQLMNEKCIDGEETWMSGRKTIRVKADERVEVVFELPGGPVTVWVNHTYHPDALSIDASGGLSISPSAGNQIHVRGGK